MASYTSNLSMKLPDGNENVSRFDMNNNFSKIDAAFGAIPSGSNVMNEISILTSPNNIRYRLKVADDGTLSTEVIT